MPLSCDMSATDQNCCLLLFSILCFLRGYISVVQVLYVPQTYTEHVQKAVYFTSREVICSNPGVHRERGPGCRNLSQRLAKQPPPLPPFWFALQGTMQVQSLSRQIQMMRNFESTSDKNPEFAERLWLQVLLFYKA